MNYCKIENGLVTNVARWATTITPGWDAPNIWVQSDVAQIGWAYDNGVFTAPVVIAPTPSTDPADYPLTMRQLRQALLTFGDKPVDFVASVVSNIPDATQRGLATIWYEETTEGISWAHAETQLLIAASGLATDQAAALWLRAKDL